MTCIQDLPAEIHFSIFQYLSALDCQSFSQTCQNLRPIYSSYSLENCLIYTNFNFKNLEPKFRVIPLNTFLFPHKYQSWFNYKAIRCLAFSGDLTKFWGSFSYDSNPSSPLNPYTSLVNVIVKTPPHLYLMRLNSQMYRFPENTATMINEIIFHSNNNLLHNKTHFSLFLDASLSTLLPKIASFDNVTHFSLSGSEGKLRYKSFPVMPNLTHFVCSPGSSSGLEFYKPALEGVARCPNLTHVRVYYFTLDYDIVMTVKLLPETLVFCGIEIIIIEDLIDDDFVAHMPIGIKEIEIPQVTHYFFTCNMGYLPENSMIPMLRFPRLIGLLGHLEHRLWPYMLAHNNRTRCYALRKESEKTQPRNIYCNMFNITVLDMGYMEPPDYCNLPLTIGLLSKFSHLTNLTIELENDGDSFLLALILFSSRSATDISTKDLQQTFYSFFQIMEKINNFFEEAASDLNFKSILSRETANYQEKKNKDSDDFFSKYQKFFFSEELPDDTLEDLRVIEERDSYSPSKIILDYEKEFPESFKLAHKMLNPSSTKGKNNNTKGQKIDASFFLELIVRPDIFNRLAQNNPWDLIQRAPLYNKFKKHFEDALFHPSTYRWEVFMGHSGIDFSEFGQDNPQLLFAIASMMASYSCKEHFMKVALNDLKCLEYLKVQNGIYTLPHSFWLRSVIQEHPTLKEIRVDGNLEPYYDFAKIWINTESCRIIDAKGERERNSLFNIMRLPSYLEDYTTGYRTRPLEVDVKASRREMWFLNYLNIDVEAFRKGYHTGWKKRTNAETNPNNDSVKKLNEIKSMLEEKKKNKSSTSTAGAGAAHLPPFLFDIGCYDLDYYHKDYHEDPYEKRSSPSKKTLKSHRVPCCFIVQNSGFDVS